MLSKKLFQYTLYTGSHVIYSVLLLQSKISIQFKLRKTKLKLYMYFEKIFLTLICLIVMHFFQKNQKRDRDKSGFNPNLKTSSKVKVKKVKDKELLKKEHLLNDKKRLKKKKLKKGVKQNVQNSGDEYSEPVSEISEQSPANEEDKPLKVKTKKRKQKLEGITPPRKKFKRDHSACPSPNLPVNKSLTG